jgi:transcriptional regulator with XRE-family HTH domain
LHGRVKNDFEELLARESVSQEKLAEFADVHRNYIGLVERAEQNLTLDSLVRIAGALKCKPSDLMKQAGG